MPTELVLTDEEMRVVRDALGEFIEWNMDAAEDKSAEAASTEGLDADGLTAEVRWLQGEASIALALIARIEEDGA